MSQVAVIATDELQQQLDDSTVRIVDCSVRMGRPPHDCPTMFFHKSHIPGAQFLDLDNLRNHSSNLPFMLPSEKLFSDTMKRLNIKKTDKVVLYDTGSMQFFGYRAAWMFEAMGHPNTFVLNGGFAKWVKENKPIESTAPTSKQA
mmetsp:Transcript_32499/g.49728  ORF Transcript_32499/g.49728 Transcript_32499/m.49728 type:complete len:145 (+) Transcript_32499:2-436(+)